MIYKSINVCLTSKEAIYQYFQTSSTSFSHKGTIVDHVETIEELGTIESIPLSFYF